MARACIAFDARRSSNVRCGGGRGERCDGTAASRTSWRGAAGGACYPGGLLLALSNKERACHPTHRHQVHQPQCQYLWCCPPPQSHRWLMRAWSHVSLDIWWWPEKYVATRSRASGRVGTTKLWVLLSMPSSSLDHGRLVGPGTKGGVAMRRFCFGVAKGADLLLRWMGIHTMGVFAFATRLRSRSLYCALDRERAKCSVSFRLQPRGGSASSNGRVQMMDKYATLSQVSEEL